MAEERTPLQVCFMPWAGLKDEVRIGSVVFWPWQKEKVAEKAVAEHLDLYFTSYVNKHGNPVDTIVLCSIDSHDNFVDNEERINEIRTGVDALIFSMIAPGVKCAVCANNKYMPPATADRFQLAIQKFRPGDKFITVQSGFTTDGGWQIGELKFHEPWCKGGPFCSPDKSLIAGLDKLYYLGSGPEARTRILRSLEWFRLAHTEVDEVSPLSKIVMMCTAFEILLDLPDRDQTRCFAEQVDQCLRVKESFLDKRVDGKGQEHEASLAAWCAWDFYKLRSSIVHGDDVSCEQLLYKDWFTHLVVADVVFWQCLVLELLAHRCVGDRVRKMAADFAKYSEDESDAEFEASIARSSLGFGFDDVHRALAWLLPDKQGCENE